MGWHFFSSCTRSDATATEPERRKRDFCPRHGDNRRGKKRTFSSYGMQLHIHFTNSWKVTTATLHLCCLPKQNGTFSLQRVEIIYCKVCGTNETFYLFKTHWYEQKNQLLLEQNYLKNTNKQKLFNIFASNFMVMLVSNVIFWMFCGSLWPLGRYGKPINKIFEFLSSDLLYVLRDS